MQHTWKDQWWCTQWVELNVRQMTNNDVPTSKKNFVAVVTAPSSSAMMAHLPSQGYQSPHKLPPTIFIESRVNKLDPTSAEPRLSRPPGHHSHPLTGYMGRKLDKVKKEILLKCLCLRFPISPSPWLQEQDENSWAHSLENVACLALAACEEGKLISPGCSGQSARYKYKYKYTCKYTHKCTYK